MRSLIILVVFLAACNGSTTEVQKVPYTDSAFADDGILIIGDSVSLGYTRYVEQVLPCATHAPKNDRDTWYILANLDSWLAGKHYRIVHVNAGLWDIAHRVTGTYTLDGSYPITTSHADYLKNVGEIISKIQATGATVIWGTMTNVPDDSIGRISTDAPEYNSIARTVAHAYGVDVDGLYSFMLPHADQHIDQHGNKVHYTKAGYQMLASHVVEILKAHGGC